MKPYRHQYLIIELDREYLTEETKPIAEAIMLFKKIVGVQAAKIVKRIK